MDQKQKLQDLHKEASDKFDEYLKAKGNLKKEHEETIHKAKADWHNAWNKLMEVLMVLENLEI